MKHQIRKSLYNYWLKTSGIFFDCFEGDACLNAISHRGFHATFTAQEWATLELVENDERKIGETWNKIVDDFHQKNSPKNHNT